MLHGNQESAISCEKSLNYLSQWTLHQTLSVSVFLINFLSVIQMKWVTVLTHAGIAGPDADEFVSTDSESVSLNSQRDRVYEGFEVKRLWVHSPVLFPFKVLLSRIHERDIFLPIGLDCTSRRIYRMQISLIFQSMHHQALAPVITVFRFKSWKTHDIFAALSDVQAFNLS